MKGTVFDIQRFSVHDGPGIRTTIFMKGCPLRCRWCHNPEGLSGQLQLQFLEEQCIGCGACGERKELSDAQHCPTEALKVCGRIMDEGEVLKEVWKDRMFYGCDGGLTFSGGECLLQADFVAAVLQRAKSEGLHTAIDTCGCVPWKSIEKTVDCCDLYLYDVKCVTPQTHKEYTGMDNEIIIENLKKLSKVAGEIWIRVPVIPGFNNSKQEMTKIAELVSGLPAVSRVTLMPYHSLGAGKYKTLGLIYPFDTDQKIEEGEMEAFKEILESRNIPVI